MMTHREINTFMVGTTALFRGPENLRKMVNGKILDFGVNGVGELFVTFRHIPCASDLTRTPVVVTTVKADAPEGPFVLVFDDKAGNVIYTSRPVISTKVRSLWESVTGLSL